MKHEKQTIHAEALHFSEGEIEKIIKDHVISEYGRHWADSFCNVTEITLPTVMGDIDERTEIIAVVRLIKEN